MMVLKNTFKNIRRAPYQAIASILVLCITFFVAQLFVLLLYIFTVVLNYFETQPQVTAFFQNGASEEEINQLKVQMEGLAYVSKVNYISKQDALEIYRKQNSDDPLLLEMVTADILPASLEVSAKSVTYLSEIQKVLSVAPNIEEVVYHKDIVDTLTIWTKGIRSGGLILILVLGSTSILVMTVIISMKVSSRRAEINTMRLLGAKPWFIRGPFILEGVIYGIIGAFIAWSLLGIALLYLTPVLLVFFKNIPVIPIPWQHMVTLLLGSITIGGFIGIISGGISSNRYSK